LPIVVIGGGLSGSLLSLELAERRSAGPHSAGAIAEAAEITLVAPPSSADPSDLVPEAATALSYASIAGAAAAADWRRLQRRHGLLGWRRAGVVLHDGVPVPRWWPPDLLALPTAWLSFSRIAMNQWRRALPAALAAAGVRRLERRVIALEAIAGGGWELALDDGSLCRAERVVLAAGAGCRQLWPALPQRLCTSWAGVLVLPQLSDAGPWLAQVRRGRLVFPRQLLRPALERGLVPPGPEPWVVDVGLAPWREGALLGQISWLAPDQPDPVRMEAHLRAALSRLDPLLGSLPARYSQVPVAYCRDGQPLAEAVTGAPGLWVLTGASNAFSALPRLSRELATAMAEGGKVRCNPA
jgi:glycine/D-amino acid oxidase-like deaminating enzyme